MNSGAAHPDRPDIVAATRGGDDALGMEDEGIPPRHPWNKRCSGEDLHRDPRNGGVGPRSHSPTHGKAVSPGATRGRVDECAGRSGPGRALPSPVGDLGDAGGGPRTEG